MQLVGWHGGISQFIITGWFSLQHIVIGAGIVGLNTNLDNGKLGIVGASIESLECPIFLTVSCCCCWLRWCFWTRFVFEATFFFFFSVGNCLLWFLFLLFIFVVCFAWWLWLDVDFWQHFLSQDGKHIIEHVWHGKGDNGGSGWPAIRIKGILNQCLILS